MRASDQVLLEDGPAKPLAASPPFLEDAVFSLQRAGRDLGVDPCHDVTLDGTGRLSAGLVILIRSLASRFAALAIRMLAQVGIQTGTDCAVPLASLFEDAQARHDYAARAVGPGE